RPDSYSSIAHQGEFQPVVIQLGESFSKFTSGPCCPIEKHVHSNQFFLWGCFRSCRPSACWISTCCLLILCGFENLWHLAQSRDYGISKFLRPDFLFTYPAFIDVVGMYAVFDCP